MTAAYDYGARPELAYVRVDQIDVDHRYQRTLESKRSRLLIDRLVAGWHWSAAGVIKLTRDAETGRYWAEDGQHRLMAAKRLRIPELPAEIVAASGMQERARIFVAANRDRVSVNQFALHHALIAAGDDMAVRIDRCCRAADVAVPRFPIPASSLKPNQTLGIGAITKLIKAHGEADAARTLRTLREAYPTMAGALRSHLILGVAALYAERPGLAEADVIAALKRRGLEPLESAVASVSRHDGEARAVVAARLIGEALGGKAGRLAPEPAVPPPVAKPRQAGPAARPKKQGAALLPAGRPNTVRNVTKAEAAAEANRAIDAFIAKRGVRKCPTAAVAPTEARLGAEDVRELRSHQDRQEAARREEWERRHPRKAADA